MHYILSILLSKLTNNRTAGCPDGYYRNETSGTCSVCRPGYIGPNCSVSCGEGFYGTGCQQQCSSSCSICNIIDGSCPKVCRPGYIGPNCSVSCGEGFYGTGCQQQCSSSCSICNIIDGSCPKDITNTTDAGNVNTRSHLIQRRNRSSFYIVTTFGCVTVVALLLVLMFYTYKLATQPLPQNFTFTVQEPESDAGRNIVNPACGSIYENI